MQAPTHTFASLSAVDSIESVDIEQTQSQIVSQKASNVSISSETDHSSEESADEASSSDETDANASWTRSWESDRMNDKSSMQILVEWVVSEDNYARWNNIRQDGPVAI